MASILLDKNVINNISQKIKLFLLPVFFLLSIIRMRRSDIKEPICKCKKRSLDKKEKKEKNRISQTRRLLACKRLTMQQSHTIIRPLLSIHNCIIFKLHQLTFSLKLINNYVHCSTLYSENTRCNVFINPLICMCRTSSLIYSKALQTKPLFSNAIPSRL